MILDYKLPDVLVANLTDTGACDKCCFNGFFPACFKLQCEAPNGKVVHWTLTHDCNPYYMPELWHEYARTFPNYTKMCAEKIAQAQKTK